MKKYGLIVTIILILILIVITGVLLKKYKNNETINYEIITDTSAIEGTKSENDRGYEVVEKDNEYYLIIYHGEEPTYYSKLEVLNVEIKGKNVEVTVRLPKHEGMGDAFSYPKAVIKLDKEPEKINIIYK